MGKFALDTRSRYVVKCNYNKPVTGNNFKKRIIMKKILIALLMALLAAFCFAGCAGGEQPGGAGGGSQSGAEGGSGSTPQHTHTYNESFYVYDDTTHWRASTCEHFTERGSEATHTMSGGTCSVCGYSQTGMTLDDFMANHAEKAREFAHSYFGNLILDSLDAQTIQNIVSDFVFFQTDANNKVTGLTYLYTIPASGTSAGKNRVEMYTVSNNLNIDLKEVAAGHSAAFTQYVTYKSGTHIWPFPSIMPSYVPGETKFNDVAAALCAKGKDKAGAGEYTLVLRLPSVTFNNGKA